MADETPTWSTLLGIGIACAIMLGLGIGLGWVVDEQLKTSPAFVMVGIGVGIAGAVSYTVVQFRKFLN